MRCQELLPTSKFEINHDFLPVNITNIGTVRKFEIMFQENSSIYDFYNSEALVDEFLLNVKNRIKRSNTDFFIRCGFSLKQG